MGGIGAGIVLFGIGAILRFALYSPGSHGNWDVIGIALMILGTLTFVIGALVGPRRVQHPEEYVRTEDPPAKRYYDERRSA